MITGLGTLFIAAILAVSGAAKLRDLRGSAASLRGFGIPSRLVPIAAVALPLLELTVAAALLPAATAEAAALAATALFSIFSVVVAALLLRGRRPDCGCFGRLHSAPIGSSTLARATGLAGIAAFLVAGGTGGGVSVLAGQPAAWLAVVSGGQSILLVAVLRRHGHTLARLDALETAQTGPELARGAQAPEFTLRDLSGESVSLAEFRAEGRPILLVFGNAECGPCTALLPDIARWQHEYERRVTVALVTQGDAELNREHAEEHGLELVLLQQDREVAGLYGANGTPAAVLVGPDGLVDGTLRYGAEGAEALLAQALEHSREGQRPRPRRPILTVATGIGAVAASSALAAPADDEDNAIRELKRILRSRNRPLTVQAQRLVSASKRRIAAHRSGSTKFELVAAIALMKKEIGRTKDELEAVAVPDYRPGEKGARIAKSRATSSLSYLDLVLDRFAKAVQTSDKATIERLDADIVRFAIEAEKSRRSASKLLGCPHKLEDC